MSAYRCRGGRITLLQKQDFVLFGHGGNEFIGLSEASQGNNGALVELIDAIDPHLGEFVLFWRIEHAVHHTAHANVHGCLARLQK